MHSSSPYINFLLYPSACPFGGNSGVCLFFLHVETEQRPFQKRGIRDRSGREVPRRDTNAFLLSILRSTGCVSPVKEKREKGKVANRFFPFIVTFARAHTHPCCEKLFPFSFPTCTTRLSCKRKNSLASTFPTDLWQTLFVHFFLSLFFFFQNPGFKKYWIFAIGLQQRIQTDLSRPSFRYIRRGYFWRR